MLLLLLLLLLLLFLLLTMATQDELNDALDIPADELPEVPDGASIAETGDESTETEWEYITVFSLKPPLGQSSSSLAPVPAATAATAATVTGGDMSSMATTTTTATTTATTATASTIEFMMKIHYHKACRKACRSLCGDSETFHGVIVSINRYDTVG
jgi:hypothetical protein